MWKGLADSKKTKRLAKEEIKIQDLEKAAKIIKWFEDVIKTKKKGIINVAFHQGMVFKRFKEKEKDFFIIKTLKQFAKEMKKIFNVEHF